MIGGALGNGSDNRREFDLKARGGCHSSKTFPVNHLTLTWGPRSRSPGPASQLGVLVAGECCNCPGCRQ